jgi:hypothetical protein
MAVDVGGSLLVVFVVLAVVAVKVFRGPLGEAIADRLRGTAPPDPGVLDEIEGLKNRLAEVEERLDFAERLLAQTEQPERLPGRTDR